MKIDGKAIASEIKKDLIKQVIHSHKQKIIPHLAVILIGHDPASCTYVHRKELFAKEIKTKISVYRLASIIGRPKVDQKNELINLVNHFNSDKDIHGIIIQRPIPLDIKSEELNKLVIPDKDVDGFHPNSSYTPPVANAVLQIINNIYQRILNKSSNNNTIVYKFDNINNWIKNKRILLIGRGETAGKPITATFNKYGIKFQIAHSQTKNLKDLCLLSDIIISCVGKANIVRQDMVTNKTILIGVGMHPEENILRADYQQDNMAEKVLFYTPVPGGVGPVNVACLFVNLLKATQI